MVGATCYVPYPLQKFPRGLRGQESARMSIEKVLLMFNCHMHAHWTYQRLPWRTKNYRLLSVGQHSTPQFLVCAAWKFFSMKNTHTCMHSIHKSHDTCTYSTHRSHDTSIMHVYHDTPYTYVYLIHTHTHTPILTHIHTHTSRYICTHSHTFNSLCATLRAWSGSWAAFSRSSNSANSSSSSPWSLTRPRPLRRITENSSGNYTQMVKQYLAAT